MILPSYIFIKICRISMPWMNFSANHKHGLYHSYYTRDVYAIAKILFFRK